MTATVAAVDLERRLLRALDFAAAAVADFGETGYADDERPALGFGPEKVAAEAAMLAYAAYGASASPEVCARLEALLDRLGPLVRSSVALADMALRPDQVFRRVVPHVLLTAMGRPDDTFDGVARALASRVLAHAVDQPATVLAERRWITEVWGGPFPAVPPPVGTALDRPFDLLVGSREDPYGLTHLLFYVTDFGRAPGVEIGRSRRDLLADVEALVIRYLDHGDYDLLGELLMVWPQLGEEWSPVATFAFGLLAHVEDEVGLLPCGNVDAARLARLEGAERTRYARAASYHTALVMGFLCAVTLRAGSAPPVRIVGAGRCDAAWQERRAALADHQGDWLPRFDGLTTAEKRALSPMLSALTVARAVRQQDFAGLHDAVDAARRDGLPLRRWERAAAELLGILGSALTVASRAEVEGPARFP